MLTAIIPFLYRLQKEGIFLWEEGGNLKINGPKENITPEIKHCLKENKASIIALLKSNGIHTKPSHFPLIYHVDTNNKHIPLSLSQQRLWFAEQYQQEKVANYHIPYLLTISGPLQVDALEKSVNHLAARHESLRTVFRQNALGEIYQEVLPASTIPLHVEEIDYSCPTTAALLSALLRVRAETKPGS